MYFEKDYILRVIDMMGEFFARLLALADRADQQATLDGFCRERCGLSLNVALELDERTLKTLLDEKRLFLLSEALYLEAQLIPVAEEKARRRAARQALLLLSGLFEDDSVARARSPRLKELTDALRDWLSPEECLQCARFFLNGEALTDCEDMIFLAVEGSRDPGYYVTQGLALLYAMRALPDETLVLGGMPREDVERAIIDLRKLS
ncbi:MAG: hypothetical protein IJ240_01810 [Clostridia bacterium]|nr:hypothetical protein [Clostridia bacterium]